MFTVTVAALIKTKTTVGHPPRKFSHLLWHFLAHGGEILMQSDWTTLIEGGFKIPCYVTLHENKLVAQVSDIIARENHKATYNTPP